MAKFFIKDFAKLNDISGVIAVSWEIALDKDFLLIVDETTFNRDAIPVWSSPLYRLDSSGMYDETTKLFVRCKIYTENNGETFESDWFTASLNDDNTKQTKLTNNKGEVIASLKYDDSEAGYKIIH